MNERQRGRAGGAGAAGMPIDYFVESIFNYPTLAERYKVAALDGINRARAAQPATPLADAEPPALAT